MSTVPQTRFYCRHSGCSASYRRKEHLRRHEAQHVGASTSACPLCNRTFTRRDTLNRHIRQDHQEVQIELPRARQACRQCHISKVRCHGGQPCRQCLEKKNICIFDDKGHGQHTRSGMTQGPCTSSTLDLESAIFDEESRKSDIQHYVRLYFTLFHPRWPFLHQGSFSIQYEPSLLVYAVVTLGMWCSKQEPAQRKARELHERLGRSIEEQQTTWQDLGNQEATLSSAWPIATYQGILLYILSSILMNLSNACQWDLTVQLPQSDRKILAVLIESCRRHNVFYYPAMVARYQDIDDITCIWAGVEEMKRFALALYKVSRICGVKETRLALSDLQFPAPDNNNLWMAMSNQELAELLSRMRRDQDSDASNNGRWISECSGILDNVNPGFEWI